MYGGDCDCEDDPPCECTIKYAVLTASGDLVCSECYRVILTETEW